ncbi:MAG: hypothetical protein LC737_06285 [Chloroflexi bacterium]|nr:hypothetical protein [Chloroflexota bacterium]
MPTELLSSLVTIHRQLASTGVLYMFACGVWGLTMYWRKRAMDSNYRGILTIGYVLGDIIGVIGMVLLLAGARPSDPLHILYGLLAALTIPATAVYLQDKPNERKPLIYGLVSFFVFGVLIRGIITANR